MVVRKRISGGQRLYALGYGSAAIIVALLIANHATFEWSGAMAAVIGLFGVGGIVRCVMGYDEL